MMQLLEMDIGSTATLVGVEGNDRLAGSLRQLGMHPGDLIRLLRVGPLGGPLLVEINRRSIALGRRVAEKVRVEIR